MKSIYYLLANQPYLSPISGDRINEINACSALSKNYDVYYNNRKFNFADKKYFGTNPKDRVMMPSRKYDLYYVRNNREVFLKLPNPKIYFCVPNHQNCFRKAAGMVVTTDTWRDSIKNDLNIFGGIYKSTDYFPKILVFNQIAFPEDLRNHQKTLEYRKKYSCDFLIGYFGRITQTNNPIAILKAIDTIKRNNPGKKIRVIYAGRIKTIFDIKLVEYLGFIDPGELKYLVSACDLTVYNEMPQGNFSGSLKTMLSISHGIPIIMKPHKQRILELGEGYPLYTNGDYIEKIQWLMDNPDEIKNIGDYLLKRSMHYNLENSAKRYKNELSKLGL